MNTKIEIHSGNESNLSDSYIVWYKVNGLYQCKTMDANQVDDLFDSLRQKEQFFMGKFKFKISEYKFLNLIK